MRSLKRRFNSHRNDGWTTIVQFYGAVYGQRFSKDRIRRWFNALVDPDDYDLADKMALLKDLYKVTNRNKYE